MRNRLILQAASVLALGSLLVVTATTEVTGQDPEKPKP